MRGNIISVGGKLTDEVIARCREIIAAGGVIVYPTDTYYALGADPTNAAAVRRLFAIKGRQEHQPILLLLSGRESVAAWAADVNGTAERLMERYWPGPLTLVFEARKEVLPALTGGTGTIGLRVPGSALTRDLLGRVGMALTGTSANRTGQPAPVSAEMALQSLGTDVDLVLDGGPATIDRPSTVVDVRGGAVKVIRQGALEIEQQ
jgi:L-threonylcarbamoyladenylate synthase